MRKINIIVKIKGIYEGNWLENKMQDQGKLYYKNGQLAYIGEWQDDCFHGKGIVFNDNPQQLNEPFNYHDFNQIGDFWISYEGYFSNDCKNGQGIILLTNGDKIIGTFKNDKLNGTGQFQIYNGKTIYAVWKDNLMLSQQTSI